MKKILIRSSRRVWASLEEGGVTYVRCAWFKGQTCVTGRLGKWYVGGREWRGSR